MLVRFIIFSLIPIAFTSSLSNRAANDFVVFTVATNQTDGFLRLMRSAKVYNMPVKVLGMGEKWLGGDMKFRGGGHKVNLFRKALKPLKNDRDRIVMFTDSYDVLFIGTPEKIVTRFLEMDSRIVFSGEINCWPDETLHSSYPATDRPYKYLNSGGLIGYAADLYELLDLHKIENLDDDQLYYTKLFLDKKLRETYKMKIDYNASIFQTGPAAGKDLKLIDENHDGRGSYLENLATGTQPLVLHGNGPNKMFLNSMGNYLAKSWDAMNGCTACPKFNPNVKYNYVIVMGIFISYNTPFLEEFFEKIYNISYPKNKLHLYIYNSERYHDALVKEWEIAHLEEYASIKLISVKDDKIIPQGEAREEMLQLCLAKNCGYLFVVDSIAHIDNPLTLSRLIQDEKGVVGPMIARPNKAWSNFWGALNVDGFYARSFDYMDIVNNDKRGIWNVPYLSNCYLINGTLIKQIVGAYTGIKNTDYEMGFAQTLREKGIFMFVDNMANMGHLIEPDTFNPSLTNPEFYQLMENQWDWEHRYIHKNYSNYLLKDTVIDQPCPDVYWFPVVSERFCKELIEIMETFGKWSSGTNNDERLAGGYENVPTRDIHMNQVGLERQWLYFLGEYIRPIQEKVFLGYFHDPPKSLMNFVVRYKPDEQPSLRPHHDSSTYTINIALNRPGVDFTGGGCRFLRYNCSITNTKVGWTLMHPGRLTHYHEGLRVNSGTRYIMISFVDP